ncbi:phage tail protein [Peribacillus muralis]|uniref:phage tail protein n=1 Tax=Peribacillus muralis TaxID=264697 RepID=UPI003CFF451E
MSVRETHILIDVIANADPLKDMNNAINDTIRQTKQIDADPFRDLNDEMRRGTKYSHKMRESYYGLTDESRRMLHEMKYGWQKNNKEFLKHKNDLIKAKYGYFELAKASGNYKGTTQDLMRDVQRLGKIHKDATDNMINNNKRVLQGMYQQAGTFMNMTTQAKRISENYDRMNNPLLLVNKNSLRAADGLNRLANRGNAAVLALSMLGPNAGIKKLRDMTMMINQGMIRMTHVAIGAAISTGLLAYALTKLAFGAKPSEVFQEQAAALAEYRDAVKSRTTEIAEAWGIFENIQLKKTSGGQLTKNLQEQVNAMTQWKDNLGKITQVAGKEFADYLSSLGPTAAGEVAAISKMSEPELTKYVDLWRQKMGLSKQVAVTELEGLKLETDKKIKELQSTLKPFGLAWEQLKQTAIQAIQPMVTAFTMVMVPIMNFLNAVGQLVIKFNELHPAAALVIQAILMLIPVLTLLLSPLAAGIGLIAGFKAALAFVAPFIMPLITGLAAMSSTVWLVAAALVAATAGIIWLWNNVQWFRDGVTAAWEWIKTNTIAVWAIISASLQQAISAISTFVSAKLAEIKAFWSAHGTEIMAVVNVYMTMVRGYISVGMALIKTVFSVGWTLITSVIRVAWELIKLVINNSIAVITGLLSAAMAIIQGDWEGAWTAIKGTAESIWHNIEAFFAAIDLTSIGKNIIQGLINGISSMAGAALSAAKGVAESIKGAVTGALNIHSPSRVMFEYGGFVTEGLGLGIEDGNDYVKKMALEMTGGVIPNEKYSPGTASGSSVSNSRSSVTLSPTIYISGTGEDGKGIKDQVKEVFEEMFDHLNFLYEPEGEY